MTEKKKKKNLPGGLANISDILKQTTILGECYDGKLPRDAAFTPEFLEMSTRLVAAGLSEADLAYILGTTKARIQYWKRHHPLFKKACTNGKDVAKSFLIAQGLKAAAGYNTIERNVKFKTRILDDGTTERYIAEESQFHKHIKPDSTLLVFMLANLSRQLKDETPWTSQHKIEVEDNKTVNVKISGKIATEQIDRLAGAFLPVIEGEVVDVKADNNDAEKS